MELHPIQGGVEILLVASCYENRNKLHPNGPLGSYTDVTFTLPLAFFFYMTRCRHERKFWRILNYLCTVQKMCAICYFYISRFIVYSHCKKSPSFFHGLHCCRNDVIKCSKAKCKHKPRASGFASKFLDIL